MCPIHKRENLAYSHYFEISHVIINDSTANTRFLKSEIFLCTLIEFFEKIFGDFVRNFSCKLLVTFSNEILNKSIFLQQGY